MQPEIHAFVVTASEVFKFNGPVVEFFYCRDSSGPDAGWPSQWAGDAAGQQAEADLDRLEDLGRLPYCDGSARTVLCIGALEHAFEPCQAVDEMVRTLSPGGMLLVASAVEPSGRAGTDQYWRPTPRAIARLLGKLETTLVGWRGPAESPHAVFGLGFKKPSPDHFLGSLNRFLDQFHARIVRAAESVGWWSRLRRLAADCLRGRQQRLATGDDCRAQFVVHTPVNPHFEHHLLAGCLSEEASGNRLDLRQ